MKERLRYVEELIADAEVDLAELRGACFTRRHLARMWRTFIYRGRQRAHHHLQAALPKLARSTESSEARDILERRVRRWMYESAGTPRKDWEHV